MKHSQFNVYEFVFSQNECNCASDTIDRVIDVDRNGAVMRLNCEIVSSK